MRALAGKRQFQQGNQCSRIRKPPGSTDETTRSPPHPAAHCRAAPSRLLRPDWLQIVSRARCCAGRQIPAPAPRVRAIAAARLQVDFAGCAAPDNCFIGGRAVHMQHFGGRWRDMADIGIGVRRRRPHQRQIQLAPAEVPCGVVGVAGAGDMQARTPAGSTSCRMHQIMAVADHPRRRQCARCADAARTDTRNSHPESAARPGRRGQQLAGRGVAGTSWRRARLPVHWPWWPAFVAGADRRQIVSAMMVCARGANSA